MYQNHDEKDIRGRESSADYDQNDVNDLDEESISLANELLPEYYDLATSVGSQEVHPMEHRPADDTRMIVQELLDRVELLSRENSLLKQMHFQDGTAQMKVDNDYLNAPLGNRRAYHTVSERANRSESRGNFTSGQVSSAFSGLSTDDIPVFENSRDFSHRYHSSVVESAVMPSQLRVTFNECPEERSATDSSVQSEAFRSRVIRAIQRHRVAVSELRNIICSELQNGTYNVELLPPVNKSQSESVEYPANSSTSRRAPSASHFVNLRKPIWFRDILSNE